MAEVLHLIQPRLLLTNLLSTSVRMTESYFLVMGAELWDNVKTLLRVFLDLAASFQLLLFHPMIVPDGTSEI